MSGWNLPPGVTPAMIDAHFGGRDEEECFCFEVRDEIAAEIKDRPWFDEYAADEIAEWLVYETLIEMCEGCRLREKREGEEAAAEDAAWNSYYSRKEMEED